MAKKSKEPEWRDVKPPNTSWEPNMANRTSCIFKVARKQEMRETLGTAWGIGVARRRSISR